MCIHHVKELMSMTWYQNMNKNNNTNNQAHLLLVGSGTSEGSKYATGLLQLDGTDVRISLHVDPKARLYKAMNNHVGILRTFIAPSRDLDVNPLDAILVPLKGILKGYVPIVGNADNPWLQGCTLVCGKQGNIRFALFEESPGQPKINKREFQHAIDNLDTVSFHDFSVGGDDRGTGKNGGGIYKRTVFVIMLTCLAIGFTLGKRSNLYDEWYNWLDDYYIHHVKKFL
jgi:hypothetical protein